MLRTYTASCHCGAVNIQAELDLSQPTYRCNCTICRRTRFWAAVAGAGQFSILRGKDDLTRYVFNSKKNMHYFCKHCGVRVFGHGTDTPMGEMFGINLGCVDGLDDEAQSKLTIVYINGLDNKWQEAPAFFSHL